MPVTWMILASLAVVVLIFVALFNGLVRSKNLAQEGWSGIDVQLKRRADLIPNLVEAVKGYAGHERTVLEKVTEMRAQALKASGPAEREKAEGQLAVALSQLLAVAERYPDLKASANFQEMQKSLADAEEQIQLARRYYNAAARELNIKIGSFPSNLVAVMFRFRETEYFQLDNTADRATPNVKFSS